MSTISSPRPSIASSRAHSPTPSSSRRPSVEIPNASLGGHLSTNSTSSTARGVSPSAPQRRNRAALRDYYNLKPPGPDAAGPGGFRSRSIPRTTDAGDISNTASVTPNTELDNPNFDAQKYIDQLLATSSLSTVLKAENSLVGDIKTLDGERKALVYDNYSKLIRAVETIGAMRKSMEERGAPLTMTKTLGPAVAFVAETASGLIREGEEQRRRVAAAREGDGKRDQQETVKWVLGTPERLKAFLAEGRREDAEKDWSEIEALLKKWEGVKGVAEVRSACEKIMKEQPQQKQEEEKEGEKQKESKD
ncbi:hypothetical protein DTO027B5_975 [Paecilomyces variotii]|nr:hypothetical protein DTO169C6_8765 [Paecilomyces variotii]KAJ9320318.1 hypothetical protein DTO027B3_8685 [Paecilomyces variotii]KAJ9337177.1 hypothetical protein DTO027B5_975 [Paecilomyces variotii]KAJ9400581.1 hypothetical protein DTO282F9_2466 [Paecilomyces variotii]